MVNKKVKKKLKAYYAGLVATVCKHNIQTWPRFLSSTILREQRWSRELESKLGEGAMLTRTKR